VEAPSAEDLQDPCWRILHDPYWDDDEPFDYGYGYGDGFDGLEDFEDAMAEERRMRQAVRRAAGGRRPHGVVLREVVEIDGLKVEFRRKAMVNLRLHVEPGGLIWLSMPYTATREAAVDMFRKHRTWVDRQLERFAAPPPEARLWGKALPGGFRGAELDQLYRVELERQLEDSAPGWIDRVGQAPERWTLRWMTSRWGSCASRTRRITLNPALAALPVACFEEVLVHELVHLIEPNHGPGFAAQMDRLLPNWRETRAAMRKTKPLRRPV
jgi:predicted metal-dependent hydrolase